MPGGKYIPDTQREAFEKTKTSGFCQFEKSEIVRLLRIHKDGLTPRELAERIPGVEHVYCLRPRITELKKKNIIRDSGRRKSYIVKKAFGEQIISREMVLVLNREPEQLELF